MINNVFMEKMTIHLFPFKTNYTNKFSIPKLRENSPFHIYNVIYTHITDDQPTFTIMENQGKSIINNVFMEKDDHKFIVIQNKLHQSIFHTQIEGKQFFSSF